MIRYHHVLNLALLKQNGARLLSPEVEVGTRGRLRTRIHPRRSVDCVAAPSTAADLDVDELGACVALVEVGRAGAPADAPDLVEDGSASESDCLSGVPNVSEAGYKDGAAVLLSGSLASPLSCAQSLSSASKGSIGTFNHLVQICVCLLRSTPLPLQSLARDA